MATNILDALKWMGEFKPIPTATLDAWEQALRDTMDYYLSYREAGYPYGKTVRGLKKWRKQKGLFFSTGKSL
jgi:hypothetical protein